MDDQSGYENWKTNIEVGPKTTLSRSDRVSIATFSHFVPLCVNYQIAVNFSEGYDPFLRVESEGLNLIFAHRRHQNAKETPSETYQVPFQVFVIP